MKLHYAEVLNPRKVCALAKHLDAPVAYHKVDLSKGAHMTPAFKRLNPNCKVPVLEDGDKTLWEADAILCHIALQLGSPLWPHDGAGQVEVLRWLSWNQVHFQPLGGKFYFERVIKPMFGAGQPDEAKLDASVRPFERAARVLDAHLSDHDFLLGKDLSIADFSVAGPLAYRDAAGLPLGACPAILSWMDRLDALPAWRNPFPAAAL